VAREGRAGVLEPDVGRIGGAGRARHGGRRAERGGRTCILE
jgi:hypothetical protein